MKNFFKGMDLNNTIAYMVEKHSKYTANLTYTECVLDAEWVSGEENYRKISRSAYVN